MHWKMLITQFSYNFKKPLKKIQSSFSGYLNQYNSLVMKNNYIYFFEKNGYHTISIFKSCMITIFS